MRLKLGKIKIDKNTIPNITEKDTLENVSFNHYMRATEDEDNCIECYAVKGQMWYGKRNYHCVINLHDKNYLFKIQVPNKGPVRQKYCFRDVEHGEFDMKIYDILVGSYNDIGFNTLNYSMVDLEFIKSDFKNLSRFNDSVDIVDSTPFQDTYTHLK